MEEVILTQRNLRMLMDLVDTERKILGQGIYPPKMVDDELEDLYEKLIDIAFMGEPDEQS